MPNEARIFVFCSFKLEAQNERLWARSALIRLRPKTLAVLRCLVERPNQLIETAEFLSMVWRDVNVTTTVLRVCIRELRQALGDQCARPRFIETVHTRGYRFVAPVAIATGAPEYWRWTPKEYLTSTQTLIGDDAAFPSTLEE